MVDFLLVPALGLAVEFSERRVQRLHFVEWNNWIFRFLKSYLQSSILTLVLHRVELDSVAIALL